MVHMLPTADHRNHIGSPSVCRHDAFHGPHGSVQKNNYEKERKIKKMTTQEIKAKTDEEIIKEVSNNLASVTNSLNEALEYSEKTRVLIANLNIQYMRLAKIHEALKRKKAAGLL